MPERAAMCFPLIGGHTSFFAAMTVCFEKWAGKPLQLLRSKRQPMLCRSEIIPVIFPR
ncbi:MAG TPA: hypothetical protein VHY30_09045 [Verrucomicrobiae bacterium]|nr:hypothetical protein [Verrucomicrobiae bacterium]